MESLCEICAVVGICSGRWGEAGGLRVSRFVDAVRAWVVLLWDVLVGRCGVKGVVSRAWSFLIWRGEQVWKEFVRCVALVD